MKQISLYIGLLLWVLTFATALGQESPQQNNHTLTTKVPKDSLVGNDGDQKKMTKLRYEEQTGMGIYVAGGLADLTVGDDSYGSTPISVGRSTTTEMGFYWNTRMFRETNFLRLKYGLAIQWNKLAPRGNTYFVDESGQTLLEEFPFDLKKSHLRLTNLVVPLYFEFGPSKRIESNNYVRFSSARQFKIGFGGYAGFNVEAMQKLKYTEDGRKIKQKIKRNYNTTDFVYGLGAYVGYDAFSLFAKYDLSPVFKDQPEEKNLLSLGFRIDLE